jgi:hypothetical protein
MRRESIARLEKIESMTDVMRERCILRNLRRRSDVVRGEISRLARLSVESIRSELGVTGGMSLCERVYYYLHALHFAEDPLLAQSVVDEVLAGQSVLPYVRLVARDPGRLLTIGGCRQLNVRSDGFDYIRARHLAPVEEALFAAVDAAEAAGFSAEIDFLQFAAALDILLEILHLPFDGAGRANEDFVVYLAARLGFPLTFSETSYRGALGSPLVSRRYGISKRLYRSELLGRFAVTRGIEVEGLPTEPVEEDLLVASSTELCFGKLASLRERSGQSLPDYYADWNEFLQAELRDMIGDLLAKGSGGYLESNYPLSLKESLAVLSLGRGLKYISVPTDFCLLADLALALSRVKVETRGGCMAVPSRREWLMTNISTRIRERSGAGNIADEMCALIEAAIRSATPQAPSNL